MILQTLQKWATSLKQQVYALYLAARSPETRLLSKIIIGLVVAYALSPIDLIPDFIPVLGYLDDLILLPLGIWLAIRLIPNDIWHECQLRAASQLSTRSASLPVNRYAAFIIIVIWFFVFLLILVWLWPDLVNILGKINS